MSTKDNFIGAADLNSGLKGSLETFLKRAKDTCVIMEEVYDARKQKKKLVQLRS